MRGEKSEMRGEVAAYRPRRLPLSKLMFKNLIVP